jgi:hypothetical protein
LDEGSVSLKTLDFALRLFAMSPERLRSSGISVALAILRRVRKIIFSAQ